MILIAYESYLGGVFTCVGAGRYLLGPGVAAVCTVLYSVAFYRFCCGYDKILSLACVRKTLGSCGTLAVCESLGSFCLCDVYLHARTVECLVVVIALIY